MLLKKKTDPSYLLGQFVAMFQLLEGAINENGETPIVETNLHKLSESPSAVLSIFIKELPMLEKNARKCGKSLWMEELNKIFALVKVDTMQSTPLNNDEYMKGYFQQLEGHQ